MTELTHKKYKSIRTMEALGLDVSLIPEKYLELGYEIVTCTGFGNTLEIGFILPEDVSMVKELSIHMPAAKLVTSKKSLFALRLEKGGDHVGFTHFSGFWEDNIFYCLYVVPAPLALKLRKEQKALKKEQK